MSTCGDVGSHVHALIKELAVRRVQHRSETYSNESQKCRKERVGSVAANPDNLGSNKEVGGGVQVAQGLSNICTSRESVSPLSRLIRGFRNKYP